LYTVPDNAPARCPGAAATATPAATPDTEAGNVRFGLLINPDLTVHAPRTRFGIHQMVAWIARFSRPVTSGKLSFGIWRDECGQWMRVYISPHIPYNPGIKLHTRGILPALRLEYGIIHPGTYQVRYVNGRSTLATGRFILTG
jgi:hypothetical protein